MVNDGDNSAQVSAGPTSRPLGGGPFIHHSPFTIHHSAPRRWPHRLAVITAGATILLIFVGGLVTNTGSALAVPDWPTTFGYNMFLYPWSRMVGGVFYEHSHRLIGSLVGLLTV